MLGGRVAGEDGVEARPGARVAARDRRRGEAVRLVRREHDERRRSPPRRAPASASCAASQSLRRDRVGVGAHDEAVRVAGLGQAGAARSMPVPARGADAGRGAVDDATAGAIPAAAPPPRRACRRCSGRARRRSRSRSGATPRCAPSAREAGADALRLVARRDDDDGAEDVTAAAPRARCGRGRRRSPRRGRGSSTPTQHAVAPYQAVNAPSPCSRTRTSSKPSPHAAYFSVRSPIVDQNPGTARHPRRRRPRRSRRPRPGRARRPSARRAAAGRRRRGGRGAVAAGEEAGGGGAHRGCRRGSRRPRRARGRRRWRGRCAGRDADREEDEVGVEGGAAEGVDAQRPVGAGSMAASRRLVARPRRPPRPARPRAARRPRGRAARLRRGVLAEERDRAAPRAERRGGLAADEARPDDDDARARPACSRSASAWSTVAEHAHAVELGAVDRRPDGLGAGGEDARGVRHARRRPRA